MIIPRVTGGIVFLFIWNIFFGSVFAQNQKEKLQKTKQQLEDEIRFTNELLEKTKRSKQSSLENLKILNKQIRTREKLMEAINREIREVEVDLEVEKIQIGKMSAELQQLRNEYARMIVQAYRTMNGRSRLAFIFSSKDFNQAYLRIKYYQQYTAYRRQQAEKILQTQSAIELKRKQLELRKEEKLRLLQAQEKEKAKLDQEKQEKAKTIRELTSKEKQLLATLRTKQQAASRLQNEIEKLISAEIRASTGKGGGESKKSLAITPVERELSSSFAANKGSLPWPCDRGFISGTFGEHPHPVLTYVKVKNNGIDIMTEPGAVVKAVFNGKVSKIMSFPNMNKVIIVRHGEYLTVYSNLADVSVREGQELQTKQPIGRVFTDPGEMKTELHFEIWKGKTILNPEHWLAGR